MAAASAAMHLGAQHSKCAVRGGADRVVQRLVETRPPGTAFELGVGREQRQVAACTGKDALAMFLQQRTRSRALGALLAQDLVLLRRELCTLLRVGLLALEFLGGLRRRRPEPAKCCKAKKAGQRGEQDA